MILLRDSGVHMPPESPCAKALAEVAGDAGTPGRVRALALATLVATTGSAPGKLVRESMEDKDPAVRAAGATAFAKPRRRPPGAVSAAAAAAGFVPRGAGGGGGGAWCARAAISRCRSCSRC